MVAHTLSISRPEGVTGGGRSLDLREECQDTSPLFDPKGILKKKKSLHLITEKQCAEIQDKEVNEAEMPASLGGFQVH